MKDTIEPGPIPDLGLTYYPDNRPGIRRQRNGRGFSYKDTKGRTITDAGERARLASLAVPPAWEDVLICPRPSGHLQATGFDQRGRYHPGWTDSALCGFLEQ